MIVRNAGPQGLLRVNGSFREHFGFTAEELVGTPVLDWIEPTDRPAFAEKLEVGNGTIRARHRTKSGAWVELDWQVRLEDEGPFVLGILTRNGARAVPRPEAEATSSADTMSDILRAMALIIEDERAGMKCSVLLLDDERRRVSVGAGPSFPDSYNEAVQGLMIGPGVGSCGTAAYWNQRVIVEDIQKDVLWRDLKEHAAKAGVASCWSHPIRSKTGEVLGATALYNPVPRAPTQEELDGLETAARMFGLAIDRGRAEEALRKSESLRIQRERELEDQLHQAAKMEALGVLAGGLAHDFNNLLATVVGNAELAMTTVDEGGETYDMLRDIRAASRSATELCNQMLAYAGRGLMSTQRVECNDMFREFGALLHVTISKKARIDYQLSEQPLYVEADRAQFGQVLMNLITNAAEALGSDCGTITARTGVREFSREELVKLQPSAPPEPGRFVWLSVADTGCGMTRETQSKIFDPFFTTKFTGRGLGLAAVRGIIVRHHGAIGLESELGVGTTFTVVLPCVDAPEQSKSACDTRAKEPSMKRVLVVDDEPVVRKTLTRILKSAGFDVLQAADGREAIDVFGKEADSIDCVLLDLSMPELDGAETFRELKQIRRDVRVVLNSGYTEHEIQSRFQDAGFAGVLQKPTSNDVLVATLNEAAR